MGPPTSISLAAGRDRRVFGANELTANILMGQLPLD
jgi:hypothetical protein